MKRELERKIFDLQTSVDEVDRGNDKRLKKELKKYRMLYRDAKKATETQVTECFCVYIYMTRLIFVETFFVVSQIQLFKYFALINFHGYQCFF